jgi:hypothetical protein
LDTQIDNTSGAWFPGDGSGTPASFTTPITGIYTFTAHFQLQDINSGNTQANSFLISNGSALLQYFFGINLFAVSFSNGVADNHISLSGTVLQSLSAGDVITFGMSVSGSTAPSFEGYVVSPSHFLGCTISEYRIA